MRIVFAEVVVNSLDRALWLANEKNQFVNELWKEMKTKQPHITIIHRNAIDNEHDLWDRCTALHECLKAR